MFDVVRFNLSEYECIGTFYTERESMQCLDDFTEVSPEECPFGAEFEVPCDDGSVLEYSVKHYYRNESHDFGIAIIEWRYRVESDHITFDRKIETPYGVEFCHATGYEYSWDGEQWYYQFVDSDFNEYYG